MVSKIHHRLITFTEHLHIKETISRFRKFVEIKFSEIFGFVKKIYQFSISLFNKSNITLPTNSTLSKEVTETVFPRLEPKVASALYRMIKIFDTLAEKHHIIYWAEGGTLLGAIRHGGIIPWDDDGDLQILPGHEAIIESNAFLKDLDQHGLKIVKHWGGYKLCLKTSLENGKTFCKGTDREFSWPFVDIFTSKRDEKTGHIVIDLSDAPSTVDWSWDYWTEKELAQTDRVSFGPIKIAIPHSHRAYLERNYGPNCMNTAVRTFDHFTGKPIPKQIVKIVNFAPAQYDPETFKE